MEIINRISDFWNNYYYLKLKRLKKKAKYETNWSIILHMSFFQSVNVSSFVVLLSIFFEWIVINKITLFLPAVLISIYNIKRLDKKEINFVDKIELTKKEKKKILIYDIYDIVSTIIFMIVLYVASKL